eukprot:scaffold31785_cov72-Phaeocystis_antarctica.AAC.2
MQASASRARLTPSSTRLSPPRRRPTIAADAATIDRVVPAMSMAARSSARSVAVRSRSRSSTRLSGFSESNASV